MQQRRLFVTGAALLASILLYLSAGCLIQPPTAAAHAFVIGSDPVDSSTIGKVPDQVHIYFNAPISALSSAQIFSIQGQKLVDVSASPGNVTPSNPRELVIPLKTPAALPHGGYEVYWTAVANDDGHTTFGLIGFNVGFSSTGLSGVAKLGPTSSNNLNDIRALDFSVVWEWLVLAASTFWLGILFIEQYMLAGEQRSAELLTYTHRRTYVLQWYCLAIAVFSDFMALILRAIRLAEQLHTSISPTLVFNMIVQTNYGRFWLLRWLLLIGAMVLLYRSRQQELHQSDATTTDSNQPEQQRKTRALTSETDPQQRIPSWVPTSPATKETPPAPIPAPRYRGAWLLIAGLLKLLLILTSPAQTLQPHISAIVFAWLNLIALAIWLGSFAYLAFLLLPLFGSKEMDYHKETLVNLLRRLTLVVLVCIGCELVSGLFLANSSINDAQLLISDPYGRTLLLQSVLTALMIIISLYVLYVSGPRLTRQVHILPVVTVDLPTQRARRSALNNTLHSLKLTATGLTFLGLGILLCMALLAFFAPPIVFPDVTYKQPDTTGSLNNTQTKTLGTLSVTLQVQPGRSGVSNTVIVIINDSAGKSATDAQVQLATNMPVMDMGIGSATIGAGNPLYVATFDKQKAFNMAGLWHINVTIQRPGQPVVQGLFEITIQ